MNTVHPDWLTPRVRRIIRRALNDFMARAFGEELARVNRLPLAERRAYVAEMIDYAASKGVATESPAIGVVR